MATTFEINFGEKKKASVSPMTVVYYDEEFSTNGREVDFVEDFITLANTMERTGAINGLKLMRLLWACEKTYVQGIFPSFKAWVAMLPNAPLDEKMNYEGLVGAVKSEFFRNTIQEETTEKEENKVSD